jgi:hypothetical protein
LAWYIDHEEIMKILKSAALVFVSTLLSLGAMSLLASRNSAGTYSLPSGNPVTGGTVISSTWANNTLGDLATEVTNSLDRSGRGGMLAPMRTIDGSSTFPAWSWTNESGTGWYRAGAYDARFRVSGVDVLQCGGGTDGTATLRGRAPDGASAVGVVLDNSIALSTTGAKALSVQNAGVEKLAIDKDGNLRGTSSQYIAPSLANGFIRLYGAAAAGDTNADVGVDTVNTRTNGYLFKVSNHGIPVVTIPYNGTPIAAADAATKGYVDGVLKVKAWAYLTCGSAGSVTVTRGFNVASASWSSYALTVNYTAALSGAGVATATPGLNSTTGMTMWANTSNTSKVVLAKFAPGLSD